MRTIDIVFDGPPGPVAGRFVEVEDASGKSISFGEWIERDDGYWVLRIPDLRNEPLIELPQHIEFPTQGRMDNLLEKQSDALPLSKRSLPNDDRSQN